METEQYAKSIEWLANRARYDFLTYVALFRRDEKFIMGELHRFLIGLIQGVTDGTLGKRNAVSVPPQHGKALEDNTPIPTPTGWIRVGDLNPGDEVFSHDGTVTRVLAVKQWEGRECFRLTMDDGSSIEADEAHDWSVSLCRKRRGVFTTHSTRSLYERKSPRSPMLPSVSAVNYRERKQLVPAYILGLWLGDGTIGLNQFTSSVEDQSFYFEKFSKLGFHCKQSDSVPTRFSLLHSRWFAGWLRKNGLDRDKRIPVHYLLGSLEQRMNLLRGLIDSDGHVAPDGQVEFCNTRKGLALDVLRLVHSLGIKASIIEGRAMLYGKDCGEKFRVMFYADEVASLPRKASRCRLPKKTCRYIETIEPIGKRNTTCIQVDHPSCLFLAGVSFIPTHNSTILSIEAASWLVGRFPDKQIAITGYSYGLTTDFSRAIRDRIEDPLYSLVFPGVGLDVGHAQVHNWMATNGSGVIAKSVGSKLTGRKVDWLIVDDPHAGRSEAESLVQRERVRQWYFGDCVTRMTPDGSIFIIGTRFHPQDLIGTLTDPDYIEDLRTSDAEAEIFSITALKAVADGDDPLGRKVGEAVFPEVRNEKFLNAVKAVIPSYEWSSQYQCEPVSAATNIIDIKQINVVDHEEVPWDEIEIVRGWDLALTEKQTSDWSAGALIGGRHPDPELVKHHRKEGLPPPLPEMFILDMFHDKLNWTKLKSRIKAVSMSDVDRYGVKRVGMEAVSAFDIALRETREMLMGHVTVEKRNPKNMGKKNQSSKLMRAQGWINLVEAGKVSMIRAKWNKELLSEMLGFPAGAHDDQIDAITVAYESLFHKHQLLLG